MPSIRKIQQSDLCSGCGLCTIKGLKMAINNDGYLRPVGNLDNNLPQGCPAYKVQVIPTVDYDSIWGNVKESYKGYAKDEKTRRMGSSGGAITSILQGVLGNNYVDRVIVTTYDKQNPLKNVTKIVTCVNDLINYSGSRYSPSSPLDVLPEIIDDDHTYAFVGKPCDVAALKGYIKDNPALEKKFKLTISFFCAGIPSTKASAELVEKLGFELDQVKELRYRGDGWPGLAKVRTFDGKENSMTYQESWGNILNKQLQKRCKLCADGTGELADISCADVWDESENGYPSFEEKDGFSLIICRNQRGAEIIQSIDTLVYETYPLVNLRKIQPYQYQRKTTIYLRNNVLKLFLKDTVCYQGFGLKKLHECHSVKFKVKSYISTIKRVLKGRL